MIGQRQHPRQHGAPQIRRDHDADPGQAVHCSAGYRGEQEHGQDLRDDRATDPTPTH